MTKYSEWIKYFEQNQWPGLPFAGAPPLSPGERELITKSLRQFQLGEGAGGRTLRRLGAQFAQASGEAGYPRSLELFIAEEQRHSAMLGQFLDREGIERQRQDSADSLFRWVRKLWNHECMLMVLVSAECVAVPYYSALRDATTSPLLGALCRQILRDEAMHLIYQGQTLAKLSKGRGFWMASVTRTLHRVMVLVSTLVVYGQHGKFCRSTGWTLEDFLGASFQALGQVERRLPGSAVVGFSWSARSRPPLQPPWHAATLTQRKTPLFSTLGSEHHRPQVPQNGGNGGNGKLCI